MLRKTSMVNRPHYYYASNPAPLRVGDSSPYASIIVSLDFSLAHYV